VRAGHHHERIELEILHRTHRGGRPFESAPAPTRPQSAASHHVAAGGHSRDLEQRILLGIGGGRWGVCRSAPEGYHTRVKAMESSVVRNVVDAHSDSSHD